MKVPLESTKFFTIDTHTLEKDQRTRPGPVFVWPAYEMHASYSVAPFECLDLVALGDPTSLANLTRHRPYSSYQVPRRFGRQ